MRITLLAALVALAGCGSDERSATIAGTTYSSNDEDGTATIKSAKGTVSVAEGASAANTEMPVYAPRYPGSTIKGAIKTDRPGRHSTIVTLATDDAPKAVAQFYKDRFTENGLAIKSESLMEVGAMISAEGAGKKTSVTISREGRESTVVVSFSTT